MAGRWRGKAPPRFGRWCAETNQLVVEVVAIVPVATASLRHAAVAGTFRTVVVAVVVVLIVRSRARVLGPAAARQPAEEAADAALRLLARLALATAIVAVTVEDFKEFIKH